MATRRRSLLRALAALLALAALALGLVYLLRPDVLLDAEYARLAWRAQVRIHTIDAGGHRWSYFDGGRGATLVLVHGFTGSKENWLDSARFLTGGHRVIVPDLPGWGASQRIAGEDYGVEAQARRLVAFLDALALERVHLVGHSMGGHIAGLVAARSPARLASLTLLDSAGVRFEPNAFAQRVLAGETPFNFGDRAQFDAFMHELFVDPRWLPARLKDVLIERNVASHAFHAQVLRRISSEPDAFLLEQALPRIGVPLHVAWCRDDRLLDASSVATIRTIRADADVVWLDGCSHMPMMEEPAELAAALREVATTLP